MSKFKTIGILGGLGPGSSWFFEKQILETVKDTHRDQDFPPVIHFSATQTPPRIAHLEGMGEDPVPSMVNSLNRLKLAGADFAVIICNTAHVYFEQIQKQVNLPLIHLIEETVKHLKVNHSSSVIVLGTLQTKTLGLYSKPLQNAGIEEIVLSNNLQNKITEAIFNPNWGIKATGIDISDVAKNLVNEVVREIKQTHPSAWIICGCTEISMALEDVTNEAANIIDPLKIVARICVNRSVAETETL